MTTGPYQPASPSPGLTGPVQPADGAWRQGPRPTRRGLTGPVHPVEGYADDGYYDGPPPGPRLGVVIGVSALASAVTAVVLYLALGALGGGTRTTVPALVGQSAEHARASAESAGLTLVVAGKTHDSVIAAGHVALQSPLAGTPTSAGAMVAVTLSDGPSQVTLPSLAGTALAGAIDRLKEMGLALGETVYQPHETLAAGTVITTEPGPGTVVTPGTRIKLLVAKEGGKTASPASGQEPKTAAVAQHAAPATGPTVTVPRVGGVRLQFAITRLRAEGLSVGRITYSEDEDHMDGMVLSQSPAGGAQAARGSAVDLVVNKVSE